MQTVRTVAAIAVLGSFGSLSDFGVRKYLQTVGLDPEKDVRLVQMGGLPKILSGIQAGAIQGGALSSPSLSKAKLLGYRELKDLGALGIKYPGTCYMTTESYIRNQRPILIQFLKGIIDSAHYVKTHKEPSIAVLKKYTKMNEEPVLEDTYQVFVERYIRSVPDPSN